MKKITNNFLASLAVFSELCNSDGELINIIGEFTQSVFALEKQWTLDSSEITHLLKKHFDFDIPEAVIRTALIRLKDLKIVNKVSGKYTLLNKKYDIKNFTDKLDLQEKLQHQIQEDLIKYYEVLSKKKCDEHTKQKLISSFLDYLMDNGTKEADYYFTIISSFLIENSKKTIFVSSLNQIKEGLVLLEGLKYTSDFSSLGHWNNELTIYLDTEHLFNAVGYNGELYQKLFDDFYSLVKEINVIPSKQPRKLIHLKYFGDTRIEVERFFDVAARIIKREENLSPDNIAMAEICKGCTDISDIIFKKTKFYEELTTRGITLQDDVDYHSKHEYNMEDQELFNKYNDKYEEHVIASTLYSFTKINYLRKGNNRTSFEACKHIILTGKAASMVLSMDLEIKNQSKDIPFVTNIYFVTNRLWFKMNKGLSKSKHNITSLDTIAKARIVLSAQVDKSIEKKYESLQIQLKDGKLSKATAENYYKELREMSKRPEEISSENIGESLNVIFDDDIEKYLREQSSLRTEVMEGRIAKEQLKNIAWKEVVKNKNRKKTIVRRLYSLSLVLILLIACIIPVNIILFINFIKTSNDTLLSIFGLILTIGIEILGLLKYRNKIILWLKKISSSYYLKLIKTI